MDTEWRQGRDSLEILLRQNGDMMKRWCGRVDSNSVRRQPVVCRWRQSKDRMGDSDLVES